MAFDEHGEEIREVYRKLILGKLEVNEGMLVENIVAQMLRCSGHKLYFFAQGDNEDASNRMELDFLISKSRVTSRHNIIPIEVKSSVRYTLSSLRKCMDKFGPYLSTPVVLHDKDLSEKDGILYSHLHDAIAVILLPVSVVVHCFRIVAPPHRGRCSIESPGVEWAFAYSTPGYMLRYRWL